MCYDSGMKWAHGVCEQVGKEGVAKRGWKWRKSVLMQRAQKTEKKRAQKTDKKACAEKAWKIEKNKIVGEKGEGEIVGEKGTRWKLEENDATPRKSWIEKKKQKRKMKLGRK